MKRHKYKQGGNRLCECGETLDALVHSTPDTVENWEEEFDNGIALRIGNAGKSEGIINVRRDIKDFIRTQITLAEERGRKETLFVYGSRDVFDKGRQSMLQEILEYVVPEDATDGIEDVFGGVEHTSFAKGFKECREQIITKLKALEK